MGVAVSASPIFRFTGNTRVAFALFSLPAQRLSLVIPCHAWSVEQLARFHCCSQRLAGVVLWFTIGADAGLLLLFISVTFVNRWLWRRLGTLGWWLSLLLVLFIRFMATGEIAPLRLAWFVNHCATLWGAGAGGLHGDENHAWRNMAYFQCS